MNETDDPFWIAQITAVTRFENTITLRIEWFHNQNQRRSSNRTEFSTYVYERFIPEYDIETHDRLIDDINSPSVLHVFKKLNQGGFLPTSIINKIEKSLNIKFKKPLRKRHLKYNGSSDEESLIHEENIENEDGNEEFEEDKNDESSEDLENSDSDD